MGREDSRELVMMDGRASVEQVEWRCRLSWRRGVGAGRGADQQQANGGEECRAASRMTRRQKRPVRVVPPVSQMGPVLSLLRRSRVSKTPRSARGQRVRTRCTSRGTCRAKRSVDAERKKLVSQAFHSLTKRVVRARLETMAGRRRGRECLCFTGRCTADEGRRVPF